MGRIFFSFEEYEKALDTGIEKALQNPDGLIQTNAKAHLKSSAFKNVYSYPTDFEHPVHGDGRRWGEGGILDASTYRTSRYSDNAVITKNVGKGFTLHIYADAEWQQLFGPDRAPKTGTLAEVIEKNGMYGAPARPWMEEGGNEYAKNMFGSDLVKELEKAGL